MTLNSNNFYNSISNVGHEYTLRLAALKDACEIWTVMDYSSSTLKQKEHFICDDLNYVKDILISHGFGVVACDIDGKIVGNLLVKYPGLCEENLGYDVFLSSDKNTPLEVSLYHDKANPLEVSLYRDKNDPLDISLNSNKINRPVSPSDLENHSISDIPLTSENLKRVVHMDSASVLPEHRGHHLESCMITFAESHINTSKYIYSFATVAPDNHASLKSLERNGYQVMITKEKYGGLMRCVLMKKLI